MWISHHVHSHSHSRTRTRTRPRPRTQINRAALDAEVPEYVDADLLNQVDELRGGFAKSMRVPTATRERFINVFSGASEASVAVLIGGLAEEREG